MIKTMDLKNLTGKSLSAAKGMIELNQRIIRWKIEFDNKGAKVSIDEKLDKLIDFMDKQLNFNKYLVTRIDNIDTRLDSLDDKVERMMNTPTMKKELS